MAAPPPPGEDTAAPWKPTLLPRRSRRLSRSHPASQPTTRRQTLRRAASAKSSWTSCATGGEPLRSAWLAAALYALTRWDQSRIPTSRRRRVDLGSAQTGGTTETSVAPALAQALQQVQRGLQRRDGLAVAALARPEGVHVAPYRGTLPTDQDPTTDPTRLLLAILADSRPRVLGWREVSDGLVVVLTNGWSAQRLPVDSSPALIATSMMAFWLGRLDQHWHWRALTPDHNRQLTRMAQRVAWRPVPRG